MDYLAAHPAAQDTLRGIVEWWLLKQRIVESTQDVEAALARLVAQRKLTAYAGSDGQTRYRKGIGTGAGCTRQPRYPEDAIGGNVN
jgi:hypothetical protein